MSDKLLALTHYSPGKQKPSQPHADHCPETHHVSHPHFDPYVAHLLDYWKAEVLAEAREDAEETTAASWRDLYLKAPKNEPLSLPMALDLVHLDFIRSRVRVVPLDVEWLTSVDELVKNDHTGVYPIHVDDAAFRQSVTRCGMAEHHTIVVLSIDLAEARAHPYPLQQALSLQLYSGGRGQEGWFHRSRLRVNAATQTTHVTPLCVGPLTYRRPAPLDEVLFDVLDETEQAHTLSLSHLIWLHDAKHMNQYVKRQTDRDGEEDLVHVPMPKDTHFDNIVSHSVAEKLPVLLNADSTVTRLALLGQHCTTENTLVLGGPVFDQHICDITSEAENVTGVYQPYHDNIGWCLELKPLNYQAWQTELKSKCNRRLQVGLRLSFRLVVIVL